MTQCFTKKGGIMLLLMLFAFIQGAWADGGTTTPYEVVMTFNPETQKDVLVNAQKYDNPSVILRRTSDNRLARAYYRLSYSFVDEYTTGEKDGDGHDIQTQKATGTKLNTATGRIVKVGSKAGTVTVKVTAKVTNSYKDRYTNEISKDYSFNVNSPTEYTINVPYNGSTLKSTDVLSVIRGASSWGNMNVTKVNLGKPTITYVSDNGMNIDVTKYFTIEASVTDKLQKSDSETGYTIEAGNNVTEDYPTGQSITFTAKVSDGYKATYGANAGANLTATVKIKYITSSNQIQTYVVFEKPEITKYKLAWKDKYSGGDANFKTPIYKIVDDEGNDFTDAYTCSGGTAECQNAFYKYSKDPLDYGKDLKNEAGQAFASLSAYPNYKVEHTNGCDIGWPTQQTDHCTNGRAWIPDDYIVTLNLNVNQQWEKVLAKKPLIKKDGDTKTTVAGMFYSTNQENKYEIDKGQFVLHVLKRCPEITMKPAPEETPIAKNYVMTSFNRFDLYGNFNDKASDFAIGEDWTLHLGGPNNDNDFWYTYFVPDDVAWPGNSYEKGTYPAADSTAIDLALNEESNKGTVLVQVLGSLTNKERFIPGLEMAIPVYKTETVTINGKEYTRYVTGTDGKPIPETYTDPVTNKEVQKKHVVKGTMYISQREFGNDPGSWKVIFHGEGFVPISYVVIPWNSTAWDVGSVSSHMFKIVQQESVKFILDPKQFTIPVGGTAPAPTTMVVDNFGKDLTKYYKFAFEKTTDTDNNYTTLDETAHTSFGVSKGEAEVKVTPSKEDNEQLLNKWLESDGWNPAVYGNTDPENDSYTVTVVGDAGKLAAYDIIYDPSYYISGKTDENGKPVPDSTKRETSRTGKLHFIKDGDFYPGTSSVGEAPGMNITFGTGNDVDPWTAQKVSTAPKVDGDFDSQDGQPIVLKGPNVDFDGQDEPTGDNFIPTHGGFLKLQPITNGFLTIDAHFGTKADNIKYYLLDADEPLGNGHYTQSVSRPEKDVTDVNDDESYNGEASFTYALLENHTYYLWCSQNDNGIYIHGLLFKPGFVVMRQDTESALTASMFENGYTGDLPRLVSSDKSPNVTFTETYTNWTNTNSNLKGQTPDKIISIKDNHTFVAEGNSMGERIRMRASVLGKKNTNADGTTTQQVERNPFMDISVVALPMYKPTPDEAIFPGKRVTTTNFVTRMWMTWGGWEQDSEIYPYYGKNNRDTTEANNNMLVDTYSQAESDTVGANNRTIDGFKYASSGNNNPVDENVEGWNPNNNANTFSLPVRGGYLKFEPEESGTLMVYVVQNGMTDLSDERPTNKTGGKDRPNNLRRRAMYIVDETGKNVDIASGPGKWGEIGKFFAKGTNESSADKNFVTEGVLRCRWLGLGDINFDVKDEKGNEYNSAKGFNFDEWKKAYNNVTGEGSDFDKDTTLISSYWNQENGSSADPYGKLMKVFKLSDGSFVLPTKAYVRYTFDVKAGKTYYMFMTGSKLGMAGFAFLPTGFTANNSLWVKCKEPQDGEEYNPNDAEEIEKRNKLPEPSATIYEQSGDTPGHRDVTIKSTGSTANKIDSKALKEAKVNFVNVTLDDRTFKKNEWTSICLPFSLSEYQVKQTFGTNAMLITFDSVMTKHVVYTDFEKTDKDTVEARTAHFTQHVNQLIEAGRPYFIKPTFEVIDPETEASSQPKNVKLDGDGNAMAITFKHVSLEGVAPMSIECTNLDANNDTTRAANMLKGSLTEEQKAYYEKLKADKSIFTYRFTGIYDRQQIPWYSYVMGTKTEGNGLYRIIPTGGQNPETATKPYLRGFRAYLYPCYDAEGNKLEETGQTSAAKIANMWITGADIYGETGGNVTTDIDEIVTEMNTMLTAGHKGVFNLQGQMVREDNNLNGLPQGVYIMNGKKYLIK